MARGVLSSGGDPVAHAVFSDYLEDHQFKGEVMIEVGRCYFIETVTKYWTGRVKAVDCDWIALEDAAWIADTGRFAEFLASGSPSEVEPVPDGCLELIPINQISAISEWKHRLPRRTI
jgi:hypothetical protein